uniref:Uncharacterized protein n=1 Tax=Tolypothrix bouteillei VB521301 TaxID=1479485 RepID=A0A0C1RPN4_9CYAN
MVKFLRLPQFNFYINALHIKINHSILLSLLSNPTFNVTLKIVNPLPGTGTTVAKSHIKRLVKIDKIYTQQSFPDHLAGFYTYPGSTSIICMINKQYKHIIHSEIQLISQIKIIKKLKFNQHNIVKNELDKKACVWRAGWSEI